MGLQLSDRLSPILVKELRQGRRSRALLLLAGLTILAAAMITLFKVGRGNNRDLFIALYFCLSVVGFLILPLMAHRSFVREQEDGSWQILHLTGMGPRRILAGKLATALAQVGILSLAVAPFLILSHFLSEIDLLTIALLCVAGAVLTGALTVAALFAATLPVTRAQRGVAQIFLLVGLIAGMSSCVAVASEVGRLGVSAPNLLTAIWAVFCCSYTLFEAAAARIALPTEDYAWRPRRALIVQLAALMALGIWQHLVGEGFDGEAAQLLAVLIIAAGALGMATEADGAGPPARRARFSLLAPGALSGFRLTVLLLVPTTAVWGVLVGGKQLPLLIAAPAYLVLYLCAALWLSRGLKLRTLATPDATRFALVGLIGLGSLVPWSLASSFASEQPELFLPGYVSPAFGMARFGRSWQPGVTGQGHWVLLALAVIAAVATDRMLARRRQQATAPATPPVNAGTASGPA